MLLYTPDSSQVAGTITGTLFSIYTTIQSPYLDITVTAIIGATIGFIVTTIWRLIWENFRAKYSSRFPFLKPKK